MIGKEIGYIDKKGKFVWKTKKGIDYEGFLKIGFTRLK
jgi:hypothetical protein